MTYRSTPSPRRQLQAAGLMHKLGHQGKDSTADYAGLQIEVSPAGMSDMLLEHDSAIAQ